MIEVTIYTAVPCGYCSAAKSFFESRGIPYTEVDLTGRREERLALLQRTGRRTVPQIFIGERHIGGYTDLRDLAARGELAEILGR